jgi:hypothetical protein
LFGANTVALDPEMAADAVEELGWGSASGGRRIFRDAEGIIGFANDR